jgi:hypothetical protein
VVKINPILFGVGPTVLADKVKGSGKAFQRLMQGKSVFGSSIQFEPDSSLHSPFIQSNVERFCNSKAKRKTKPPNGRKWSDVSSVA